MRVVGAGFELSGHCGMGPHASTAQEQCCQHTKGPYNLQGPQCGCCAQCWHCRAQLACKQLSTTVAVRRMQLLAVICSLVHSAAGDAMVVLRDPSGEVKAAVSPKVLQQHPAFCPGATVALKQVWPAPVSNATQGPGLHATGQIMAGRGARVPGLDSRSLALLPPSAATHGNHANGTGSVRHTPNTQRHADEPGGPGV
ncbi:domain of unknown function (DUF4539), partial [Haematococcus lacustris]